MKNIIPVATFAWLVIIPLSGQPGSRKSISADQWRQDLNYFSEQIVKRHMNAFHHVSKDEFEKDVQQLYNDIPGLEDYQVIVRLQQITAKIGDGHTNVHIPTWFKRYPIIMYWFGNDLYVTATTEDHKDILGARLVSIEETPIEEVFKKIKTVFPTDENTWYDINTSPYYIIKPEFLFTLGIVSNYNKATFTFIDGNNQVIRKELLSLEASNSGWISVSKTQPLFRQKLNEPFWFTYLPDINAVYLNFKKYDNLHQDADKLFKFIEDNKATRLIIDLRQNGGGDFKKGRRLLIERIKANPTLNQKDHLFVITGRFTFSAAMVNAIDFKKETNAILVGEPPGEKPNSYSENDEMKLPHSDLVISYSTRYYQFLEKDEPAFIPDIRIDPGWTLFKEGRDAVMEYILSSVKGLK